MEQLSQVADGEPEHGGRAGNSGVQCGSAGMERDRQEEGPPWVWGELDSCARDNFPSYPCFIVAEGYRPLP